jgi:hypothetical protein
LLNSAKVADVVMDDGQFAQITAADFKKGDSTIFAMVFSC